MIRRFLWAFLAAILCSVPAFSDGPVPPPGPQPTTCGGSNVVTAYPSYGSSLTCSSVVGSGTINAGTIGQLGEYSASTTISGITPGGDVTFSTPNFTVAKINGVALGSTTATAGNILIGSGTQWVTNAAGGDLSLTSGGVFTIGSAAVTGSKIASSVALAGAPTTTTPATADNSTKIATTAYVQAQGYLTGSGISGLTTGQLPIAGSATTLTSSIAFGQTGNSIILESDSSGNAKAPVNTTTGTFSGNATVGGTLGVTGNTTVGGTLGITGATTATAIKATTSVDTAVAPYLTEVPNAGTTGTTQFALAKLTGAGTAVVAGTSDTGGVVIGVVQSASSTAGNAQIAQGGTATCTFDGATTQDHFVQVSGSVGGNCHDTGTATFPTSGGQVIGLVLSTHGAGGNYAMLVFPPSIVPGSGSISGSLTIVTKTGSYTLNTTTDVGAHFDNSGAGGTVPFTLPAGANGLYYCFTNLNSNAITITAAAGVTIAVGNGVSGGTGILTLPSSYSSQCLKWDQTLWVSFNGQGAYTLQ